MLDPKSAILSALYNRQPEEAVRLAESTQTLTIWEAAALGRRDTVDELLARDPSLIDAAGADGNFPLGLAAFFGQVDVVRLLLERGANVSATAQNFMKVQPLHAAVAARNYEAVAMLLDRGADANARQQLGYTPLMGAASGGRDDIAELLLGHGADAALVTDEGKTAASIAAEHGHDALAAKLSDLRTQGPADPRNQGPMRASGG